MKKQHFDEKALLPDVRYSRDKPSSCDYCYWWDGRNAGCGLPACDYILHEKKAVDHSPYHCRGCPYGRVEPCIGYCIKQCKEEMEEKWKKAKEKHGEAR